MASFRQIGYQPVGSPLLQTEQDNSIKQLADIFYSGMSAAGQIAGIAGQANDLKANAINMETQQYEYEKKIEQAEKDAVDDLILQGYQIKQEAAQNELNELQADTETQTENIPQMLAENAGDLRSVLRNNPGLTGPVRRSIQKEIITRDAREDIASLDVLVAENPQKSVEELFGSFLQDKNKLGRYEDPYEKGLWQQVMNEEFNKISISRTIQQSQQKIVEAENAIAQNMQADIALAGVGLNKELRDSFLSNYTNGFKEFSVRKGDTELQQDVVLSIIDTLKTNADTNPFAAIEAFNATFPAGDAITKKYSNLLAAAYTEIESNKQQYESSVSTNLSKSYIDALAGVTTSDAARTVLARAAEDKEVLGQEQYNKIEKEAAIKAKEYSNDELVNRVLGPSGEVGPVTNIIVTPEVETSIDKYVESQLSKGVDIPSLYYNVASKTTLTKKMAEGFNGLFEVDPSTAVRTYQELKRANPSIVKQLQDEGVLTARVDIYTTMNTELRYDLNSISSNLIGASEKDFQTFREIFKNPSKIGLKSAKQTIVDGLSTWQFGGTITDVPTSLQTLYIKAAEYHAVRLNLENPGSDVNEIATLASQNALADIKSNVYQSRLRGSNIPVNKNKMPLSPETLESISSYYDSALTLLEQTGGSLTFSPSISGGQTVHTRGSLIGDFMNPVVKDDGTVVIPIYKPSVFGNKNKPLYEIVLPTDDKERKALTDLFNTNLPKPYISNISETPGIDSINSDNSDFAYLLNQDKDKDKEIKKRQEDILKQRTERINAIKKYMRVANAIPAK